MASEVGLVGTSMKCLASVEVERQLILLQDQKMELELKILEFDDDANINRKKIYQRREKMVDKQIESLMKELGMKATEDTESDNSN